MDPGIIFLGVAFVLMVLVFQRSNRQRREFAQVQRQLAPGVEVMTASGLFATIVEMDGDRVVLETGPGQRSTWDRRAIARVIPASPAGGSGAAEPADTTTTREPGTESTEGPAS